MHVYVYFCVSMYVWIQECRRPEKPEGRVGSPGAGLTGSCELPSIGVVTETPVCPLKSSKHAKPLSNLSNPLTVNPDDNLMEFTIIIEIHLQPWLQWIF